MRGFTLLEVLIGAAIMSVVSISAWYFLSLILGDPASQAVRQTAQAELDDLITTLRREWRARSPGASFAPVAGGAFLPTSTCTGLSLTQKNSAGATVTLTFETLCVSGRLPTDAAKTHPEINCPAGTRPEIKITRAAGSERRIPKTNDVIAAGACFRVSTDGVVVEMGALARSGNKASHLLVPLFLTIQDKSDSVQVLAN